MCRSSLCLILIVICPSFVMSAIPQDSTPPIQQTTAPPTRTQPAPWRPSFGKLAEPQRPAIQTQAVAAAAEGADQSQAKQGPEAIPAKTNSAAGTNTNLSSSQPLPDDDNVITRVTKTFDKLPNSAGQIWREYDISPYTTRITNSDNPQKAILDWILRETGTEMWFNQPLGILNADRNHIYVYHTPEIHNIVKNTIDRFVNTRGQVQVMDINLVTVENPNWRSTAYWMLQPIDVQSPGTEAWMISKENAAILLGQLSRRRDFAQHSSGRISVHDGQETELNKTKPRQFVQNLKWIPGRIPNFQPQMTTFNEGYKLTISALTSLDTKTIEATINCNVDQIERLTNVKVDVPGVNGGATTQMNLQIPQIVSWRLQERFRWPNDQILLLSCGVVANPESGPNTPINLPRILERKNRADALLFIEYRGPATGPQAPATANGSNLVPVRPRR